MIRVYGPTIGNGSFARVCKGTVDALKRLGLFSGIVPIDCYDEEEVYPGFDAPIGLFIGPIFQSVVMQQIGAHKERILVLAPNSSWLPNKASKLDDFLTEIASPSAWGTTVIKEHYNLPVSVLRHGVSNNFVPDASRHVQLQESYDKKRWHLAHFASTTMARKGTRELLDAWCDHVRDSLQGWRPKLTVVVDAPEDYFKSHLHRASGGDKRIETTVHFVSRLNIEEGLLSALYHQFHGIVQPSRGEGFGLIPLEARACGIPVVMTSCTGHDEHAYERGAGTRFIASGVQLIMTGEDSSIDDGPGATAPSLTVENVKMALDVFLEDWHSLHSEALEMAPSVQENWSWDRGIERWLEDRNKQ